MGNKKVLKMPSVGVAGFITCEVLKDGEVVRSLPKFQNLILDQGLNYLGSGELEFLLCCQAGTSNSTPSPSDIALGGYLNGMELDAIVYGQINTEERYMYVTGVYTSDVGDIVGNVAEIGIGTTTSGATLFSRSLVKDIGGNPTTITVLATEKLKVTYEYRVYQPETEIFNSVVDSYTVVGKTAKANTANAGTGWGFRQNSYSGDGHTDKYRNCFRINSGWIQITDGNMGATILDSITGTVLHQDSVSSVGTDVAYITGTFTKDLALNFSATQANGGSGIGALTLVYGPTSFQFEFTPNIIKTNLDTLEIVLRYSWARKILP